MPGYIEKYIIQFCIPPLTKSSICLTIDHFHRTELKFKWTSPPILLLFYVPTVNAVFKKLWVSYYTTHGLSILTLWYFSVTLESNRIKPPPTPLKLVQNYWTIALLNSILPFVSLLVIWCYASLVTHLTYPSLKVVRLPLTIYICLVLYSWIPLNTLLSLPLLLN